MTSTEPDDVECGLQDEAPRRIRWEQGNYSSWSGYVSTNPACVFRINYVTTRTAPNWELTTDLPGLMHMRSKDDERDLLMRRAEIWLARFVASLGAVFGEEG